MEWALAYRAKGHACSNNQGNARFQSAERYDATQDSVKAVVLLAFSSASWNVVARCWAPQGQQFRVPTAIRRDGLDLLATLVTSATS